MWYIVYREKFKSYTETGGGYYVKYKDKIEDEYSVNWFEAKKYKTIGPALNRLGIVLKPGMDTIEKFLKVNSLTVASKRNLIIDEIFDDTKSEDYIFSKGRIDKIGDDGKFLGNAYEDMINYIHSFIKSNKNKNDKLNKNAGKSNYIVEVTDGEDFWNGF